jgi:GNAT superfamily N-acetyltransferase
MRIYRRARGITVMLRKATASDLTWAERDFPKDVTLPTISEHEAWTLVINDENFGFIEYFSREEEVVVTGLWVRPDKRGNGYGTMMLELVESTEKPRFIRVISTPSSEGFYSKRGYLKDYGHTILTKVVEYDDH